MATDISTEQTATFDRTSGGDDRSPDTATTSASAIRPSRFAARTAAYGSSIWTDIFNLFKRHTDPIYFGDGSPAKEAIPLDLLQAGSRHSWEHAIDVLGYGDQQGFPPLRELIAQHMCGLGADVSPDTVLVTAGSTQAIDLTSKILLDPGDVVIVEGFQKIRPGAPVQPMPWKGKPAAGGAAAPAPGAPADKAASSDPTASGEPAAKATPTTPNSKG